MILRRLALALALAGALAGCRATPQPPVAEQSTIRTAPSGLPLAPLEIRGPAKTSHFTVEIARTEDEQARGLMFRATLGQNEGMIFPFATSRMASFWMKNTLIPLDMIFIRSDGTIAMIAAETVPQSLTPVGPGEPVAAVLEIPGGRAADLGIAEGDRVIWSDPRGR